MNDTPTPTTHDHDPADQVRGIDLTPTSAEYLNMARMFLLQLHGDWPKRRQSSNAQILGSLIEITTYLATVARPDYETFVNELKTYAEGKRP